MVALAPTASKADEGFRVYIGPADQRPYYYREDYPRYRYASWQEKVTDLMQRASLIVAIAGATEGLIWEIDRIISLGLRSKLVLLLPPVPVRQLADRLLAL